MSSNIEKFEENVLHGQQLLCFRAADLQALSTIKRPDSGSKSHRIPQNFSLDSAGTIYTRLGSSC